jgi:pSer/pThr/pTyr-binding forkhead associated (FHA) protein
MFEHPQEHPGQTVEFAVPDQTEAPPGWLADAREELTEPGRYLVCIDDGLEAFKLDQGWNRIGRSATADVRLDDPTVSRRHALLVWESGEPLRVLDDRSLNGILLNGDLIEWGTMQDGDELAIGRYRLFLLEV